MLNPSPVTLHDLPKVEDARGNLSFIEEGRYDLAQMRRAYWIYDVPGGEIRGSHAYVQGRELIVALSGSFDVVLRDASGHVDRIHLCRSYKAVNIPPRTWRTLENFSTNSLALVLSDTYYDEEDYIWDVAEIGEKVATLAEPLRRTPSALALRPERSFTLADCRVVDLPSFTELRRGCLTPVEECSEVIPFSLRRVFYIYDIPSGATRGSHAHHRAWQFIVAASSCFEVRLDDGSNRKEYRLDRPFRGLLVPPGIWCHLHDFSSAAVALVLTSEPYTPEDYICDYREYLRLRHV